MVDGTLDQSHTGIQPITHYDRMPRHNSSNFQTNAVRKGRPRLTQLGIQQRQTLQNLCRLMNFLTHILFVNVQKQYHNDEK